MMNVLLAPPFCSPYQQPIGRFIARASESITFYVKGHDIPHPGVTKIPHPVSQDSVHARGVIHMAHRRVIRNPPKGPCG